MTKTFPKRGASAVSEKSHSLLEAIEAAEREIVAASTLINRALALKSRLEGFSLIPLSQGRPNKPTEKIKHKVSEAEQLCFNARDNIRYVEKRMASLDEAEQEVVNPRLCEAVVSLGDIMRVINRWNHWIQEA